MKEFIDDFKLTHNKLKLTQHNKLMKEDILEIIDKNCDQYGYMYDNAAKEIADNFTRFVEWKDFSIDVGTRLDFDDNPKMYYVAETLYDIKYFDFAGIYSYWITNIRDK